MATRGATRSEVEDAGDPWIAEESLAFAEVFAEAVRAARERGRPLGIPNVQVDDEGRLTEELPDGSVRLVTAE
jgi:hypothetical protein